MSILNKTSVYQITSSDPVHYTVANAPHANLETNIDDIIAHINGSPIGEFENDNTSDTGLQFTITAGRVIFDNAHEEVARQTLNLTDNATNYIFLNTEDVGSGITFSVNTTGVPYSRTPLWEVTCAAGAITNRIDLRTAIRGGQRIKSDVDNPTLWATNADVSNGTSTDTWVSPATLVSRSANETRTGFIQIASSAEVAARNGGQKALTLDRISDLENASTTRKGLVKFATDTETNTGTATDVVLTPSNLNQRTASSSATGIVMLDSTDSNSTTKAATPKLVRDKFNSIPNGTTSVKGLVEFATNAETAAGSRTDVAVSPANLSDRLGDLGLESARREIFINISNTSSKTRSEAYSYAIANSTADDAAGNNSRLTIRRKQNYSWIHGNSMVSSLVIYDALYVHNGSTWEFKSESRILPSDIYGDQV